LEAIMAESVERRRCPRVPLEADVAFRRPRETHYAIKMHDLSAHGCRVECPERLDQGELVWVQLPSLESLPAWVRWTQRAHSGGEFDRPMHRAVFEMMAGRLAPADA
jgi:hypothetical protein